jgi:hypothetical protein
MLDECREWESEAAFLRADVISSEMQVQHLLAMQGLSDIDSLALLPGQPTKGSQRLKSSGAGGTLQACRILLNDLQEELGRLSVG